MKNTIKIGSRGSKLALWQTHFVADELRKAGQDVEIVIIETKGDKILNTPFSQIGSKGLFTEELEEKLNSKEIDIAVHSAKDMQSDLGEHLEIIAFTKREKPFDVLMSLNKDFDISDSTTQWVIGTSSTRRKAMLRHYYPHVTTTEARGNLQTRMKKLEDKNFDAMILAYAGVHRMGLTDFVVKEFPLNEFTPAVGQGSIAIEASKNLPEEKYNIIRKVLNHPETEVCLMAERAFLYKLEGGCSIPVFALAQKEENIYQISGGVISLDGKEIVKTEFKFEEGSSVEAGFRLAETILEKGGDKILQEIKKSS